MLLTNSVSTDKFILFVSEQELNLVGIAIRELRDTETEEPTSLDVMLQVDSATFAESLRHQEETLGIDHGYDDCDGSDCGNCDTDSTVPDWVDGNDEDGRENNI